MPSSNDYVEAARSYLGVRWRHQGRDRMGVDCVGLLIVAGADLGIEIADKQGYRRSPDKDAFINHIRDNSVPADAPRPGTFGIFRDGNQPCHVGIFAEMHGEVSLIHAYVGTGVVMEEVFAHDWPRRLIEVRALAELED